MAPHKGLQHWDGPGPSEQNTQISLHCLLSSKFFSYPQTSLREAKSASSVPGTEDAGKTQSLTCPLPQPRSSQSRNSILSSIYFCKYLLIYLFRARRLSLVAGSGLCVLCGLLLAMVSLDTEHSSRACRLRELQLMGSGSAVVVLRLSCLEACGIFPDRGSNPCPLQCTEDSFFFLI